MYLHNLSVSRDMLNIATQAELLFNTCADFTAGLPTSDNDFITMVNPTTELKTTER